MLPRPAQDPHPLARTQLRRRAPAAPYKLATIRQRTERQLAAIEAGVDPTLVDQRIDSLKSERQATEAALAEINAEQQGHGNVDLAEACAVLDALPDLSKPLANAEPKLKRAVYDAFRLNVELDRNAGQIRLKALVSSAFSKAHNLSDLAVARGTIAGDRFALMGDRTVPVESTVRQSI